MDNNKKMKFQLNKHQTELIKEIDKLKEHLNITIATLKKLKKIQNDLTF